MLYFSFSRARARKRALVIAKSNWAAIVFVEPCATSRSRVESYIRAGFAFSGLELRVMTLSTKYQEFVRLQVKQLGSLDFDRDLILWPYTNGAVGNFRNRNQFPTQVCA